MALTVAIPQDHKPMRLPTFPNLERTATLAFTRTTTISVDGARTATLLRSPTYPLWVHRFLQVTGGSDGVVWRGFTYPSLGVCSADTYLDLTEPKTCTTVASLNASQTAITSFIVSTAGGRYGVYVPPGTNYQLYIPVTGGVTFSGHADVTYYPTSNVIGDEIRQLRVPITLNVGDAFGLHNGGFFFLDGIQVGGTSAGIGTYLEIQQGFRYVNGTYLVPAFTPTEFDVAPLVYQSTRCTAAAALFSNVSQVMTKEGTVEAARLVRAKGGLLSITGEAVSTTHPQDRYYGLMENGLYSFTLPDGASEVFQDCVWEISGIFVPLFNLDHLEYKNTIIFSDLNPEAATTLAVTLSYHLEFRSSSMLFPVGFSTVPLETYHGVQMSLMQLGCFQENPLHWAALATAVKSAVAKIAPVVAPHLKSAAFAGGNYLLNAAADRLSKHFGQQKQMVKPKPQPQKHKKAEKKPNTQKGRGKGKK